MKDCKKQSKAENQIKNNNNNNIIIIIVTVIK